MEYKVKLQQFEGPLDLLLFLIKKQELNIYDIPIAQITKQYLEYIQLMEFLNLELAGEFLVMAATLMRIKARMLLPVPPEEAEEEEDPRTALVQQLLEYQRFKQAASELESMEYQRRHVFARPESDNGEPAAEPECSYNLFELITAFKKVLEKAQVRYIEVRPEEISLEARIEQVKARIAEAGELAFTDLFEEDSTRMDLVVTFLALLEVLKMGFASVRQTKSFGEIWIHRAPVENAGGRDQANT